MKKEKIINKIINSKQILRISSDMNNISVFLNENRINVFPIRLLILKIADVETLIGIWGGYIYRGGTEFKSIDILMDFSDIKNISNLYLKVNDSQHIIGKNTKEDIELMIYFRNDKSINFINVGYNVILNETNINYLNKKYDKVCENFITQKIKFSFNELFMKMKEDNYEI